MTPGEAKIVLQAYRPGREERDAATAEALAEVNRTPELREWFNRQQSFHNAATESLRDIPVPPGLKERVLAHSKIVRVPWWRQPPAWAAAAALILIASYVTALRPTSESSFETYRSRIVRNVQRTYSMDLVTNDPGALKSFFTAQKAPADYTVPSALSTMPLMGGGVLSWQGRHVAMVCFNGGATQGTLFLFVTDANAVSRLPKSFPAYEQVSNLSTVSWQKDGKIYVLAANASAATLQKYL